MIEFTHDGNNGIISTVSFELPAGIADEALPVFLRGKPWRFYERFWVLNIENNSTELACYAESLRGIAAKLEFWARTIDKANDTVILNRPVG